MRAFLGRAVVVVLGLAALVMVGDVAWRVALDRYAGAWSHAPEDAAWVLSDRARALVQTAFSDADGRAVSDARVLAPATRSVDDPSDGPLAWLAAQVRAHAAGVRHRDQADAEYVSRLLRQARALATGYRLDLFADPRGPGDTVAANGAVISLAARAPGVFAPVVSITPDAAEAAARLERWAGDGVRDVVWWPVAQGIDPAGRSARALYAVMARYHMTLHLPVGYRRTGPGKDGWIDPRALRVALDAGVDVTATLAGAEAPDGRALMPALFALLRAPAYHDRLRIDLAGVLAADRLDTVLEPLLQHPQFFGRLRYASGYPQPAVAAHIDLQALVDRGFLDAADVWPLREIYDVNPLLFAFVALRRVHLPATDLRLPAAVFFARTR